MSFGSCGHIRRPPGGVIANYHLCKPYRHIKSIVNTRYTLGPSSNTHAFIYVGECFSFLWIYSAVMYLCMCVQNVYALCVCVCWERHLRWYFLSMSRQQLRRYHWRQAGAHCLAGATLLRCDVHKPLLHREPGRLPEEIEARRWGRQSGHRCLVRSNQQRSRLQLLRASLDRYHVFLTKSYYNNRVPHWAVLHIHASNNQQLN